MKLETGQEYNLTVEQLIDKYRGYVSTRTGSYEVLRIGKSYVYLHCFETGHDLECRKLALIRAIEGDGVVRV